ncbi:MAG: diguanylate cyclase [Nitrospirales bacterium]|nr:diguanylate cyclase [Nitrospirales bacterium]
MRVCFPVEFDYGLKSVVYNHFGSAPMFVIVDTESSEISLVVNADATHSHGSCSPIRALGGQIVDAVVVCGIGKGALNKLSLAGIAVFRAKKGGTIEENVSLLSERQLSEFSLLETCGGHGHGGGCSH